MRTPNVLIASALVNSKVSAICACLATCYSKGDSKDRCPKWQPKNSRPNDKKKHN